ncbi:MAG: UbiA family prenyltransferase [Thermoplasmataceae archaeon]|jgi:geranylgeranylglycerol-phosphate geranylgeranyltransferase|nr:UbiA family prenyltransferase [Candidatus Thermoplasmatota archaeon]
MNRWVDIVRPVNGVMGIVATLVSAVIGAGLHFSAFYVSVASAAAIVFMVISAGNIINDVVDVEIDRLNHPDRSLVKFPEMIPKAKMLFVVLFIVPLILSILFISIMALLLVIVAEILLITYELYTKKLGITGNITISILVGLIFIFGGIAVNSVVRMFLLFGMASLANLAREITKDVQDMEGDVDRKTFPKRYGKQISSIFAAVFTVAAVIISFIPYYLGIFSIYYLLIVLVSDVFFIMSVYILFGDPERGQKISKYAMILGLAAFFIGGLA